MADLSVCLSDVDGWDVLTGWLAEMGVEGDFPLAFAIYRVEGLPSTHPIPRFIELLRKVGTAKRRGHTVALIDKSGLDINDDMLHTLDALSEIVCRVYGELECETSAELSPTDPAKPVVHRTWKTSRPWKGKHRKVVVLRQLIDGEMRYWADVSPVRDKATARLAIQTRSAAIRVNSALVEAEEKAQALLKRLVTEEQWASYRLSDCFIQKGRSGLEYLIRKNRPTVAMRPQPNKTRYVIGCLCLHSAGYYAESWAGTLPPTDDVIAHLLYIRGDEYDFWRRANAHSLSDPLGGV